MKAFVDLSGRIENTQTHSVFAISNDEKYTLFISAKDKRNLILILRKTKSPNTFYLQIFTACIFLLLKKMDNPHAQVIIDREYPGKNKEIIACLNILTTRIKFRITRDLHIQQITKKSPAHVLAIRTFRKEIKPSFTVYAQDIIQILKKIK